MIRYTINKIFLHAPMCLYTLSQFMSSFQVRKNHSLPLS